MLVLGVLLQGGLILFAAEFGDGTRDGVVKTPIEHAKVIRADGLIHFHSQLGDGLTDVAIVVHDRDMVNP